MQAPLFVLLTLAVALLPSTSSAQSVSQSASPTTAPPTTALPVSPSSPPGAAPPQAPNLAPPPDSSAAPTPTDPSSGRALPAAAVAPAPVARIQLETAPPPVPAPDPTAHRHDGFYLRLGIGAGFLAGSVGAPMGDLSVRGGLGLFEISLGGTVAEGLVIGGALFGGGTGTVHWRGDGLRNLPESDGSDEVTGKQASIGFFGVLIDYYPDPRGGFHALGGLGLASLGFDRNAEDALPPEPWEGGGGGMVLGLGYEGWVADQWSLGGVARVLLMSGTLFGADSDIDLDARAIAPGLLFTATHH